MIARLAAALVGLVFLLAGTLKALDSAAFLRQVRRYRLLPGSLERTAVRFAIGMECALGVALLLSPAPALLGIAALVLVFFVALTAWGTSSGRVEDCGCYGGLVLLTPAQSMALDIAYLALLAIAWLAGTSVSAWPAPWQAVLALAVFGGALFTAAQSNRKPIGDFALMKVGRIWKPKWLRNYPRDVARDPHFVVFLSRDCPYCKRWVPLLNVIEVQPELPSVVGVMSLQGEELDGFLKEHLIRFPIAYMPQSLVSLMVNGYPTAALVENGRIREKWVGEMPKAYLERIREFFEAVAPTRKGTGSFGG